jgi:GDP-L-fucose synthase
LREFLFVDDLAEACVFVMNLPRGEYQKVLKDNFQHVNVGSNEEIKISELAFLIKEVVGFDGEIEFLTNMPDGIPRKLLDSHRIRSLGWSPTNSLRDGLVKTYNHYLYTIRLGKGRN